MKMINKIKNISAVIIVAMTLLSACNKAPENAVPNIPPPNGTTPTIASLVNDDPNFSILKAAVAKAGLNSILNNVNLRYTLFAPDNDAFVASGIVSADVINNNMAFDTPTVKAIVSYHIVPQIINSGSITSTFPNFQYPSIFNPAPQISPLFRLTIFPTRNNGNWVNNIPVAQFDASTAVNGVVHKVSRVVLPPSTPLWTRIESDPDLDYFEAAVKRADNGTPTLENALKNPGANFTVFAPTDAAVGALLVQLGLPDDPNSFNLLPVETAKGIVVYHILGVRAFSNNIFTTATAVPTLLPAHPGVTVKVEFNGLAVTNFTVKGAVNNTASNVDLTAGEHNQHHLNGVLHMIDQVLRPQ